MTEPFRIFSGWDSRQAEAAEVFEFSVREHASIPVEISFIGSSPLFTRQGVTGFTYARFLAPSLCDYDGVAVFADGCDMLCLGDVAELAASSMDGCAVKVVKHKRGDEKRPRSWTSLMLMDCSKLKAWTPTFVEQAPDAMLMRFGTLDDRQIGELDVKWNAMCEPPRPSGYQEFADTHERSITRKPGLLIPSEPPAGARIAHWSYLSDPNGGSWIDRSGSKVWQATRDRWRAAAT